MRRRRQARWPIEVLRVAKPLEDVDSGFPHGMLAAKADMINQDLLAFVRS
jgi:hypothetical protein